MRAAAIILWILYIAAKTHARFWLYKPTHLRPAWTRKNEALKLIDLLATTFLVASFFFLVISENVLAAVIGAVVLVAYDAAIRQFFLLREALALCARSRKWKLRDARHHVRRRAEVVMYH